MKYKYIFSFFLILIWFFPVMSQEDPKAEKILNRLSEQTKASEPFRVTFHFTAINLQDNSKNSFTGVLTLQGRKYHLKTGDSEIFFDGETTWNYMPDVNEVNVLNPDPEDHSFLAHPEQLFSDYRLRFRYRFVGINKINEKELQVVDLYPVDLKENYSRIRLQIDKTTGNLHSARFFGKDGIQYIVRIEKTEPHIKVKPSTFRFRKANHPGVEVIDLRESEE
ncbi:MAG TPA: outer membrane lipoprotein carrier protein LolA [Bacteroidetes bacterium]|nr:outer membrane lipoprotein carrier protein LolA [Bacteroidota bacterium]